MTEIKLEAIDMAPLDAVLTESVRRHPLVLRHLHLEDAERIEVTAPDVSAKGDDEGDERFHVTAFDRTSGLAARVRGRVGAPDEAEVEPTRFAPLPSANELRAAMDIAAADPQIADLLARDDVTIYQPMPPLADREHDDGTVQRMIALAAHIPDAEVPHRRLAVDVAGRLAYLDPDWLDPWLPGDCESRLPVRVDVPADTTGPDRVRVRVISDGVELWSLVVVRPRGSAPTAHGKGSGVELRDVRYRGKLVLFQAHVPVLNVLYDDGVTFRDWQNAETAFEAFGSDPVGAGWRVCSQPPRTILESSNDAGNAFQGVAFWYEDGELRIVSELQAGWYRYVSDWRLGDDGTIRPRFGFAGTRNPRTCMRHQHHVYWRFDFDIDGAARDVVEQRRFVLPPILPDRLGRWWVPIARETSRKRSRFASSWRVRDRDTDRGYLIVPGPADGTADSFGVSDLWLLRYHWDELDDGVSAIGGAPSDTQIKLDQFLTGEPVDGADVVIWYGGHFVHDEHAALPHQGHIVGPELRPVNWS